MIVGAALWATPAMAQEFRFEGLPGGSDKGADAGRPDAASPIATTGLQPLSSTMKPYPQIQQTSYASPQYTLRYQLQKSNWQQFERGLVENWLGEIRSDVNPSGAVASYQLDSGTRAAKLVVDRNTASLSVICDPSSSSSWEKCLTLIDQQKAKLNGQVVFVPLKKLKASDATVIMQAVSNAYASTRRIRQDGPLPGQAVPQEGQFQAEVKLPDGGLPQDDILRLQNDESLKVVGNVTIEVNEELGLVFIKGDNPQDIERVKKIMEEIVRIAERNQPKPKTIVLQNADPTALAEQIQTVYDEVYEEAQGKANIIAVPEPRSLLVVGSPESIRTIESIARQLDVGTEVAPDRVDFRTFNLVHISSADAKQRVDDYFGQSPTPAQATPPLAAPIVTISDFRSNTLIVKASANYMQQIEKLIEVIDVEDTAARKSVKVFQIKNSLSSNVAAILQNAINGYMPNTNPGFNPNQQLGLNQNFQNQGQLQPGTSQLGSIGLSLEDGRNTNGNSIESGILFDVRVSADSNSNTVVVTAPEKSMDLIAALIDQIDRVPDTEIQIKVFQVINGDVELLFTTLQTLFQSSQNQLGGFGGGGFEDRAQLKSAIYRLNRPPLPMARRLQV